MYVNVCILHYFKFYFIQVPLFSWISITSILGIFISLSYTLGTMFLSLLAPAFKSWWTLQLTVSCASFLQFLIFFAIPESPRWLISIGNLDQAEKVLKNIAAKNSMKDLAETFKLPSEAIKENEVEAKVLGFKDLFNRRIILFTIVQILIWPSVTLGYFGETQSVSPNTCSTILCSRIVLCLLTDGGQFLHQQHFLGSCGNPRIHLCHSPHGHLGQETSDDFLPSVHWSFYNCVLFCP